MIHIRDQKSKSSAAVCGAALAKDDRLVLAAMQSDCDKCRGKLMIAPKSERGCQVKPPLFPLQTKK